MVESRRYPIEPHPNILFTYPYYNSGYARHAACHALASIDPRGGVVVPIYVKALRCKDEDLKEAVLAKLGPMGEAAGQAVPDMVSMLNDKDAPRPLKAAVLAALGQIGEPARPALPAMDRMLEKEYAGVLDRRREREREKQQEGFSDYVALLLARSGRDDSLLAEAAEAIWRIKGGPGRHVGILADSLIDHSHFARALGKMGQDAEAAVPALGTLMEDPDFRVRTEAEKALSGILGFWFTEVHKVTATCCADMDPEDKAKAVAALGGKSEAVCKLGAYLAVPGIRGRHRSYCVDLLGACGREAVPVLIGLLKDPDEFVRSGSAWALHDLGAEAAEAVDELRTLARGGGAYAPIAAIYALGAIGPAARSAVPDLEDLSEQGHTELREAAHSALWRIRGPKVVWWGRTQSANGSPAVADVKAESVRAASEDESQQVARP